MFFTLMENNFSLQCVDSSKFKVLSLNDTSIENRVKEIVYKTKFKKVDNSVEITSIVYPMTFASN
jgi:hypothetical protein